MTDNHCLKKTRSAAVHYGFMLAKRNLKYGISALIMNFVSLPMLLIQMLAEASRQKKLHPEYFTLETDHHYTSVLDFCDDIYIIIAGVCTIVAFILGAYIAMGSFAHLYEKKLSDTEYSLPLTANKRFFAGYLSGLAVYILPYIICELISVILLSAGRFTVDEWMEGSEVKVFEKFTPLCLKFIFGMLIIMLMFYTIFVMTMNFCGSKFETSVYGIIGTFFCLPVIYVCIFLMVSKYGYGMELKLNDNSLINNLLSFTSPVGAIYGLLMTCIPEINSLAYYIDLSFLEYHNGGNSFLSINSFGGWVLKCLVFTVIIFICAVMLYRRRRAEQTGKTFILKGFYYVVMVCIMVGICCLFAETGIAVVIIASLVLFMILDSITNRGVRKIFHSLVKYCAVMISILAVYMLAVTTGLFGIVNNIPDVSQLSSVEILDYYDYYYTNNMVGDLCFKDEENIQAIIDIHTEHLETYNKSKSEIGEDDAYNDIKIKYTYKSGITMVRHYWLSVSSYNKLLPIELTDEAKLQMAEAVKRTLDCEEVYFTVIKPVSNIYGYEKNYLYSDSTLPDDFIPKLTEFLEEDIADMSEEDYLYSAFMFPTRTKIFFAVDSGKESFSEPEKPYYQTFRIYDCFDNTLDYFEELGIFNQHTEYTVDDILNDDLIRIEWYSGKGEIDDDSFWTDNFRYTIICDSPNSPNAELNDQLKYIKKEELSETELEELAEIISNSSERYISRGESYNISVDGKEKIYVPESYIDMLESIID